MPAMPGRIRAAILLPCVVAVLAAAAARFPGVHALGKAAVDLAICAIPVACWLALDRPAWVRHQRRRHGLCPACGYNLTANVSGVCPECGRAI